MACGKPDRDPVLPGEEEDKEAEGAKGRASFGSAYGAVRLKPDLPKPRGGGPSLTLPALKMQANSNSGGLVDPDELGDPGVIGIEDGDFGNVEVAREDVAEFGTELSA